jgi:ELWxxDGT repeat protein
LAFAAASLCAAEWSAPQLLADIGSTPTPAQPMFNFNGGVQFVPLGGAIYFDAWDGARGQELWRSDGTAAGTAPIRDLCPGTCNGRVAFELVVSGGWLYFQADDGAHGLELWKTDGTAAGTVLVKDIRKGLRSSEPRFLTAAPGGVYFGADDSAHGFELWFSDGTEAGTHLVADILPGAPDFTGGVDTGGPCHLAMLGDVLLFSAVDEDHGRELWRTDGTPQGTSLVKDLVPGTEFGLSFFQPLPDALSRPVVAGGRMYFPGMVNPSLVVPFVSDGTAAGTMQLVPTPSESNWYAYRFFAFGDDVLFASGTSGSITLWRSNGTLAGTAPLGTAANGGQKLNPRQFAKLGANVYFPGHTSSTGSELWVTDGTVGGTHQVVEIRPGANGALDDSTFGFAATDDRVFFPADDGVHGMELWASDGSAPGTGIADEVAPGGLASLIPQSPTYPEALGEKLLYRAWTGQQWTIRALDLAAGSAATLHANVEPAGSSPFCYNRSCPAAAATNGGFAFSAFDAPHGGEPWVTDTTPAGTALGADLVAGPTWSSLPSANVDRTFASLPGATIVMGLDAVHRGQLWALPGGTQLTAQSLGFGVVDLVAWHDLGFFGTAETLPPALGVSDGTPGGTNLFAAIGGSVSRLTPGDDLLFFLGGGKLWVTDGTPPPGTHKVAPSLDGIQITTMAAATSDAGADLLYFVAADAAAGNELWISNGSEAGTQRVVDLRVGSGDGVPRDLEGSGDAPVLATHGDLAFFVGDDGLGAGEELWVTDGTAGNTVLLDVWPGAEGSEPRALTMVAGTLYFVADDGVHGREVWVSDGTPAGTHLLTDVRPGPESSAPRELRSMLDWIVFAADDGAHGMELWSGSASEGSVPIADLRPGADGASPIALTPSGDALLFFADDGTTGLEPWVVFVRRTLLVDDFETGDLLRWSDVQ